MSEPVEAKPAWILGWEAGASTVTGILTDLIAELREEPVHALSWGDRLDLADRAEARLREVTQ